MKVVKVKNTSLVVKDIYNESMLDDVEVFAKQSKCTVEFVNYSTQANVSGKPEQIKKFITLWNS